MRRPPAWLNVDWVQLGIYGWEIDESGAGFESGNDEDYIHLDRTTLDLICGGSAAFIRDRLAELDTAGVPGAGMRWVVTTTDTSCTGSPNTSYLYLTA
jgi:hypothetical protein